MSTRYLSQGRMKDAVTPIVGHRAEKGQSVLPLKGVIFDLEGTLYDPEEYERGGLRAVSMWASDRLGLDYGDLLTCLTAHYNRVRRVSVSTFIHYVREKGLELTLAATLWERYLLHRPSIECACGVIPMLEALRVRYRTGLISLDDGAASTRKLQSLNIGSRFDAVFTAGFGSSAPGVEQALLWFEESLAAHGDSLAFVGARDSRGFECAAALGWHTIVVDAWAGAGEEPGCETSSQARVCVDNVLGVEKALHNLSATSIALKPASMAAGSMTGTQVRGQGLAAAN